MDSRVLTVDVTPEAAMRAVWMIWGISWIAAAVWSDRSVKGPATRHQILYRLLAGVGFVLLFGFYRDSRVGEITLWYSPPAVVWLTVGLVLVGLFFTWWARLHLGRLWSSDVARKADHHVVDTGPYRIVRHPIYTGILLASVATAAMRGTVAAWLGAGLMTLGWYIKARLEERFLREQLGAEAYGSYARRVPMLVPFLSRNRSNSVRPDTR